MMEKELLQISDEWGQGAFPIDWSMLPSEVTDALDGDYYLENVMCYGPKGIKEKTVVYFRKVKKFRKDVTQVETEKAIFGV